MNFNFSIIFIFLFSITTKANLPACIPETGTAPPCPKNGRILDDTYPIQAATVSSTYGVKFASDFAFKTMFLQKNPVPIFVSATEDDFEKIVDEIRFNKTLTKEQKQIAKKYLIRIEPSQGDGENWQQDFMKASFDPKTGMSTIREVGKYLEHRHMNKKYLQRMAIKLNHCGIQSADPLTLSINPNYTEKGMYGGNIGSLPNGICLLGKDDFPDQTYFENYAKTACGNADYLETPSDFLQVGHTDEFINIIPDNSKPPPCNYAVAIASPQKGLELLEAQQEEKLFSSFPISEDENDPYESICIKIKIKQNDLLWKKTEDGTNKQPNKGTSFLDVFSIFTNHALASQQNKLISRRNQEDKIYDQVESDPVGQCQMLKNKDLLNYIKTDDVLANGRIRTSQILVVNNAIQKKMALFKQRLINKTKSHEPSCEPELIDIPYIFTGYFDNSTKEPKGALSVFPNPNNGQLIGNTYLMPKTNNDAFSKYIEKIYKDKSVNLVTISTSRAHSEQGNLHCSTQLMRYCQPRGDF